MAVPRKPRVRARPRPKLARGSLRAQGWLFAALWPLHETLDRELHLLAAGDLTWQAALGRLDGLKPAAEYLSTAERVNLADLVDVDGAALLAPLDRHRAALAQLTAAAAAAQPVVAQVVAAAAARASGKGRAVAVEPIAQVAEDLINGVVTGAAAQRVAAFVEAIRGELAQLRAATHVDALAAAHADAIAASRHLVTVIETVRGELCDRYDLPPAPIAVHTYGHGRGH